MWGAAWAGARWSRPPWGCGRVGRGLPRAARGAQAWAGGRNPFVIAELLRLGSGKPGFVLAALGYSRSSLRDVAFQILAALDQNVPPGEEIEQLRGRAR